MKDTHKAVLNFAYFTANFPSNFIDKCWENDQWLIPHLKEKLKPASGNCFISKGDFMDFFMELDRKNQIRLMDWITDNYLAFQEFKTERP